MSTAPERSSWAVLAVVAVGTLLSTLSGSTITLALPAIGQGLALSLEDSRWVIQAFLLVTTVALLPAGRAADLAGHRAIYLVGFLVFGIGSGLAGLAPTFALVIAARVIQGLGSAMVMAAAPALITTALPAAQRGRALGLLSTATYVGLTAGPPLGGWLIATLSWRWVFLINVPVAAVVLVLGRLFLPAAEQRPAAASFDAAGAGALGVGASLALIAASEGGRWGWSSPLTLGALGAGAAALGLFLWLESRVAAPLLDLALFRRRALSASAAAALCNYVALFVPIILIPFLLIEGLATTPRLAGAVLTAQPIAMALVASPAGWLSDRIGTRSLAAGGLALLAAALGALGVVELGMTEIVLVLVTAGLGTGLFISPNSSALMGAAPRARQGVAGAVMALARSLGMLGGTVAGTELYRHAGGRTGAAWSARDYRAFRVAQGAAAGSSLLGALCALLAGGGAEASTPGPTRDS